MQVNHEYVKSIISEWTGSNKTMQSKAGNQLNQYRHPFIIADPIYSIINFGYEEELHECMKAIIDTETFQRLRRISQLGLTSYVWPGATHTRFSHSLGTAYLAYRVMAHLRDQSTSTPERKELEHFTKEVVMTALLHDIGHGPFSHSFEKVADKLQLFSESLTHEDWTAAIITCPRYPIYSKLKAKGLKPERIAAAFSKQQITQCTHHYLHDIVSSQIDVDRMDYLIRDSHFTGVAIGHFDCDYLITSLCIAQHGGNGPKTLGITYKGIKPYEVFAFARQMMNRIVYYHLKVKTFEYMMERLFRIVIEQHEKLNSDPEVSPHIHPYLSALATIEREKNTDKKKFIKGHLSDYLDFTEDHAWTLIRVLARAKDYEVLSDLAERLLQRNELPYYPIGPGKRSLLEDQLKENGLTINNDFDIVDLSTTLYKTNTKKKVFVVDRNNEDAPKEITTLSEMIMSSRDKPDVEALLIVLDELKKDRISQLAKQMAAVSLPAKHKTDSVA